MGGDQQPVSRAVAVLGNVAYRKLFPGGGDPVGSDIRLETTQFKVIGVVANALGTEGSDDDVISVPFDRRPGIVSSLCGMPRASAWLTSS